MILRNLFYKDIEPEHYAIPETQLSGNTESNGWRD